VCCTPALAVALALGLLLAMTPSAQAAPPAIPATWATEVTSSSANLWAEVNPGGLETHYRFEYLTNAQFLANGETFAGAARIPSGVEAGIGSGSAAIAVSQHANGLAPAIAYRYRAVAVNSAAPGGAPGPVRLLTTQETSTAFTLPDGRGWEMVSPPDKNGGAIQGPGQSFGGGVFQAAAQGGAITYSSTSSFGPGAQGSPPASQYVSRLGAGGWSTENITAPTVSGAYGIKPNGVPYQLFSTDLARALMLNGTHCRGEGTGCPVANPPLPGSGTPSGYQDYYLREDEADSFGALLSEANKGPLALTSSQFDLTLAGASPDLRHVVLSTCAKLSAEATEVPSGGGGCDPSEPNLYEWEEDQLHLLNILPGQGEGTPGARLAAQGGAVSEDGSRVYFTDDGGLYVRDGGETLELAPGAEFQTATPDGAVAFFTKAGDLYRYEAGGVQPDLLVPGGEVQGVLGASEDGSYLYYAGSGGALFVSHGGAPREVASGADPSNYPPTTGTARVSADGTRMLFLSRASLTGYDNTDQQTGEPDSEVFLYDAGANGGSGALTCLSCNPTGERPLGSSTVPGAISNGSQEALAPGEILTDSYKPRALADGGRRVFFDTADALVGADTDNRPDVYQWEAQGEGSCARAGGCLSLISSGRGEGGASFIDASASGADALFLTDASLIGADPGSADLYDAREGGGFSEPPTPIECLGDACQSLPSAPEGPTVGTSIPGHPNPPLRLAKPACPKGKHPVTHQGKTRCVPKHHRHRGPK
jgi:hypothetical protein